MPFDEDNLIFSTEDYGRELKYENVRQLYRQVLTYAERKGYNTPNDNFQMLPNSLGPGKQLDHPEGDLICFSQHDEHVGHKHSVKIWANDEQAQEDLETIVHEFLDNL